MIKQRSAGTSKHNANGIASPSDCSTSTLTSAPRPTARLNLQSRQPTLRRSTLVVIILFVAACLFVILFLASLALPAHPKPAVTVLSPQQPSSHFQKQKGIDTTAATLSSSTITKLWNHPNSTLPQWMKEYFDWHVLTREKITEKNWNSYRYLVLSCNEGERCGGVSDRLKPLPFLLWLAHQSNRLLLIHWSNRPFRLEEFVVPHAAGINWTVPTWLLKKKRRGLRINLIRTIVKEHTSNVSLINVKIQTWDGGREYYEQNVVPPSTYTQVFSQVFGVFFVPSAVVSRRLNHVMDKLGLQPGRYVAAHHRANYQHRQTNATYVILASINAINCASTMWPGVPIYFCSDSQQSIHIVQDYAKSIEAASRLKQQQQESRIVVQDAGRDAIHLDKATLNETTSATDGFYDIFVDLYLMVYAQCVAYGPGGFGRFGMLLSRNASCGLRHFYRKQLTDCQWTPS